MRHSRERRKSLRAGRGAGRFVGMELMEGRVLLSSTPGGNVDILTRQEVVGWAFNADTGSNPIQVRIAIDGATAADVTANQSRPDLQSFLGSSNHGFTFMMPTLGPGDHQVVVSAIDPNTTRLTELKTATVTNPAAFGNVDVFSDTMMAGWAYDSDAGASPVSVRIDVNGSTLTTVTANSPRPDLAPLGSTDHGFVVDGAFAGKVVEVIALDVPSGQPIILKSNDRLPGGSVDILNQNTVVGWAVDADRPTSALTIHISVDGTEVGTATANQSRPDLGSLLGAGNVNHGFTFTMPALSPGDHAVKVYATDPDTQVSPNKLIGQGTATNPPPGGSLDVATRDMVAGWVHDPDAGSRSLTYEVRLDENVTGRTATVVASGTANMLRPDLVSFLGSGNFGFMANISGLSAGPHRLSLYATDVPSGEKSLVASTVIDNHLPGGSLDMADISRGIGGWANDPDPNGAVTAQLWIDGVQYGETTANLPRPDLESFLGAGNTNKGFLFATPTVTFGTHTVEVFALDTFTGEQVSLGRKQMTNNSPIGNIDIANASQIVGWAFDPDAGASPIDVLLAIDGQFASRGTANQDRPDLAPLGSTNHGFSVHLGSLPAGSHTVAVYAVDPLGVTALLGQRTIVA